MNKLIPSLILTIYMVGCSDYCAPEKHPSCESISSDPYLDSLFQRAVRDAQVIEEGENYLLTAVSVENSRLYFKSLGDTTYVKCVTWLSRPQEEVYTSSLKRNKKVIVQSGEAIWLTLVPDLKAFCNEQRFESTGSLILRLKQKLGLHYGADKTLLAEVWVPVEALRRPCLDSETNDISCVTKQEVAVDSDYHEWYFQQRSRLKSKDAYPFTGLGYTYDWESPGSEFGFSEFVFIGDGSRSLIIDHLFSPAGYCSNGG